MFSIHFFSKHLNTPPLLYHTLSEKSTQNADGAQLVHYYPDLVGSGAWGSDAGTNNDDGSYTFVGGTPPDLENYSGGGALYRFPQPEMGDTWDLEDYDFVEVYLTISDGTMGQVVRKSGPDGGNSIDSQAYPSGSQYMELPEGDTTFTLAVAELFGGISFQRGRGGPSTWAITKAVYTKGATWHTITFTGGTEYPAMEAIDPLDVLEGRPVNFNNNNFYKMPANPSRAGYTFNGWNKADGTAFAGGTITEDITLTATWVAGERELVDIDLVLDTDEWADPQPAPYNATAAAYAYANGELTLTFASGANVAGIPLTADQIDDLMHATNAIVITIDGDVTIDGVVTNTRTFRYHLAKIDSGQDWNATNTGAAYIAFTVIKEGQEYTWATANKSPATLGHLRIQIETVPGVDDDPVIVTIRSVNIKEVE
jgi:uncharacterized repeat protein (TIGR02543 family)